MGCNSPRRYRPDVSSRETLRSGTDRLEAPPKDAEERKRDAEARADLSRGVSSIHSANKARDSHYFAHTMRRNEKKEKQRRRERSGSGVQREKGAPRLKERS